MNDNNENRQRRLLYINGRTECKYQYARPYGYYCREVKNGDNNGDNGDDSDDDNDKNEIELKLIDRNGTNVTIYIIAIPDGVALNVNSANIPLPCHMRLFAYANASLNDEELAKIDQFIAQRNYIKPYPILTIDTTVTLNSYPKNNFYMISSGSRATSASRFIEYRYFLTRHVMANILYEPRNGGVVSKFVLPNAISPPIVLIMPNNFVRTGLRRGYFANPSGLIVRVYARRALSCERNGTRLMDNVISVLPSAASEDRILAYARSLLARLGMHRVYTNRDEDGDLVQIYAYDEYMTLVIGRVDNLQLP
nr:putative gp35-like protein [Apis mellifera nudivirus]